MGVGAGAVIGAVAVAGAEAVLQTSSPGGSTKTVTTTSTVTKTVSGSTTPTGLSPVSAITLSVNGSTLATSVDNRWSLADTLRYKFGLIGTKVGCDRGECGACAVLVNGVAMLSCTILAVAAQGKAITTIEGIGMPEKLSSVQAALIDADGVMCGACSPGIVVQATSFLKQNPTPTDAQWRDALSGNLCRCGNWPHMLAGLVGVKA